MQEWFAQLVRNAEMNPINFNLKTIGLIIICVGFGCIGENLFYPKNYHQLLTEYKSAKAKGDKPSREAEAAHIQNMSLRVGFPLIGIGITLGIIGYF